MHDQSIEQLGAGARQECTLGIEVAQKQIHHFKRSGDFLRELKERLGHGTFGPWIKSKANWPWSHVWANRLMQLSENWELLKDTIPDSGMIGVEGLLATLNEKIGSDGQTERKLNANKARQCLRKLFSIRIDRWSDEVVLYLFNAKFGTNALVHFLDDFHKSMAVCAKDKLREDEDELEERAA